MTRAVDWKRWVERRWRNGRREMEKEATFRAIPQWNNDTWHSVVAG